MNRKLLIELMTALAADLEDQGNTAGSRICTAAADEIDQMDRSIRYLLDAEKNTPDSPGGIA